MENTKIMIIEDEPIIALHIKKMLLKLGYSVAGIFHSGEEALEMVGDLNPNVILMDIVLSGRINGIETAKIIIEKYNIPIIYVTSHADNKTIEDADSSNHYGYLLKPITGYTLSGTISTALKLHEFQNNLP